MDLTDHLRAQALSPFHDLMGVSMLSWEEGLARLTCLPGPMHANRSGIVHGGVMLALLDQCNAFAGLYCPFPGRTRLAVTLDLDTRFTGQARIGTRLIAEGRVVTAGRNIFFARGEVKDEEGNLIAFGASTHRYRSGSHGSEGVPLEAPGS
ncbi:PaaI family thioesterase [Roseococcus pinisoli]|uniref:PaaI family thioesterase n=1 Tax=Roseococcus pinisoli TaxID=2835040 RepID=A0ABS5QAH7_9PROT|nr:PaaI family thioesterase [Roseococcus pinisoli]MBS7810711.1 PaaI family thioesterase [Roseococcus pinisoli]